MVSNFAMDQLRASVQSLHSKTKTDNHSQLIMCIIDAGAGGNVDLGDGQHMDNL